MSVDSQRRRYALFVVKRYGFPMPPCDECDLWLS